jgi:hypothetical protein
MAGTVAAYSYSIGTGASLPLGSLTNTQDLMGFPPQAQPANLYPVRVSVLSGQTYGDGAVRIEWGFPEGLAVDRAATMTNFLFGTSTNVSVAVTINHRDALAGTYQRFTGYVERPIPGEDFTYDRRFAFGYKLRFLGMVQL